MSARKLITAAALTLLLGGCASNEELFAEYDAWCQGTECVAVTTEVIYQEVPVGQPTVPWEPAVYFGYDLDSLSEAEQLRIDRNMQVMAQDDGLKLSLQAFTDSRASFAYNVDLSERRRLAVIAAYLERGLDESRIISTAGSEMLPVLPSDSVEDRIINRRVEMMLLDSNGRPLSFGIALPSESEDFQPPFPLDRVE